MYNLTHEDIVLLARAEDSEVRLEKLCEARWSRAVEIAKLSLSGSVGLITSLFVAAWKGDLTTQANGSLQAEFVICVAVAFAAYGSWQLTRIAQLQRRYLVALGRLQDSKRILKGLEEAPKALTGGGGV